MNENVLQIIKKILVFILLIPYFILGNFIFILIFNNMLFGFHETGKKESNNIEFIQEEYKNKLILRKEYYSSHFGRISFYNFEDSSEIQIFEINHYSNVDIDKINLYNSDIDDIKNNYLELNVSRRTMPEFWYFFYPKFKDSNEINIYSKYNTVNSRIISSDNLFYLSTFNYGFKLSSNNKNYDVFIKTIRTDTEPLELAFFKINNKTIFVVKYIYEDIKIQEPKKAKKENYILLKDIIKETYF